VPPFSLRRDPRVQRRWLLRALAAGALGLAAGSTPLPLVTLGPQRQPLGCAPHVGVHTRLTDEVEEWKIKRTLEMVREMGAHWAVEYFPWAYIESAPGRFDWSHSDLVVAHALRQGLQVVARLGFVPQWARPADTATSFLPQERYSHFASFCTRFAQRYGDRVRHYIVWNEPNLALEWGFRDPDPEGYALLLRRCYSAIKEVVPQAQVLGGALAPVAAAYAGPLAMGDLPFLARARDAGALESMDALAVHAYGWSAPPADEPGPDRVNFRRTEVLRSFLVDSGAAHLPVMVTEAGWNDHPRWTRAVRPAQRTQYTRDAYALAAERWPWCPFVAMWAFRYPWPQNSYQDYFSFVTPDFLARPIYHAVQDYALRCR